MKCGLWRWLGLAACIMLAGHSAFGQFLEDPPDVDTLVPSQSAAKIVPTVPAAPGKKDSGHTYGQDGPFHVYHKDSEKRSIAYRAASAAREEVLRVLKFGNIIERGQVVAARKASWKIPIVIQLTDAIATPSREAKSGVNEAPDGSLALTIFVQNGAALPLTAFRREVTRQVLTDFMLRDMTADKMQTLNAVTAPDWLLYGTLELMNARERGRPSDLFHSVFRLGKFLTVQEILNAEVTGLDAVTMGIYRVSACALLQLLLDQPEGSIRLEAVIGALTKTKEPVLALEAAFPQLQGQKNSLEKWWSIQLAASSQPGKTDFLSMQQSEQELAVTLMVTLPAVTKPLEEPKGGLLGKIGGIFKGNDKENENEKEKDKDKAPERDKTKEQPKAEPAKPASTQVTEPARAISLQEYQEIVKRKDRKELLMPCNLALTALGQRVHPFYRSIIREYLDVVSQLSNGKTRKVEDRLSTLKQQREVMAKEARETEDFIDKYEATGRHHETGEFRDYLRTAEEMRRRTSTSIPEISDYMDQMEKEFAPQR